MKRVCADTLNIHPLASALRSICQEEVPWKDHAWHQKPRDTFSLNSSCPDWRVLSRKLLMTKVREPETTKTTIGPHQTDLQRGKRKKKHGTPVSSIDSAPETTPQTLAARLPSVWAGNDINLIAVSCARPRQAVFQLVKLRNDISAWAELDQKEAPWWLTYWKIGCCTARCGGSRREEHGVVAAPSVRKPKQRQTSEKKRTTIRRKQRRYRHKCGKPQKMARQTGIRWLRVWARVLFFTVYSTPKHSKNCKVQEGQLKRMKRRLGTAVVSGPGNSNSFARNSGTCVGRVVKMQN